MARPTKFTEERVKKLIYAIRLGATYEGASRYAGIHYDTFNEWRQGRFPRKTNPALKTEFSEGLTRAEGEAEIQALAAIKASASSGDWRAAAWWLERRHREEYSKRTVEGTSRHGKPIEVRALAAEAGVNVDDVLAEADVLLAGFD